MISWKWVGAVSPTLVLSFATVLACVAFLWYRRQTASLDSSWAGWLLPSLRSLAIFLVAITLAEPVLEMRFRDGQPGRLSFLIDATASMSPAATAASPAISSSGLRVEPLDEPGAAAGTISDTTQPRCRFQRAAESLLGLGQLLATQRDSFDISVSRFGGAATFIRENNEDASKPVAAPSQISSGTVEELWASTVQSTTTAPADWLVWKPEQWSDTTDLAAAIRQKLGGLNASSDSALHSTSVVLFSDGQSNVGDLVSEVADEAKRLGIEVHTVGFGPYEDSDDLAISRFAIPSEVYRTDLLDVAIHVVQRSAAGRPFQLSVECESQVLWQESFVATEEPERVIDFSIRVDELFQQLSNSLPIGASAGSLPIKLQAKLILEQADSNPANDLADGYCSLASQRSRVLLIDGRSRWELRYLKNIFARDPAWETQAVVQVDPTRPLELRSRLPQSPEELFQFDLVFLGDISPEALGEPFIENLRQFVEVAGGGLVLVDGAGEHLQDPRYESLQRLAPVRWQKRSRVGQSARDAMSKKVRLSDAGRELDAFRLDGLATSKNPSADSWSSLPEIQFISAVETLPGAETLVEAYNTIDRSPLFVARRYGAGRVLYVATDETWKWRYKVADQIHSRLWIQLARWMMKTPMSLHSPFVSLDTGAASYEVNQAIPIRCELRNSDGTPATLDSVSAVILSAGDVFARLPLQPERIPGRYSGQVRSLPPGDYDVQISAAGLPNSALELKSEFAVAASFGKELQTIACDEATLKILAERTGGRYLREADVAQLKHVLQSRTTGKVRQSTTIVWQTYWWFAAAMLLLVCEWLIRKQLGLI